MWRMTKKIMPLVSNHATEENHWVNLNVVSRWWMPETWRDCVKVADTEKDLEGAFMVAKKLENFLLPYKHCIDTPNSYTKHRMFFNFFVQISSKNRTKINEVHLSKVIVLLKLLADPNLPVSSLSPCTLSLENLFENSKIGLDVLNLLFSYGYRYELFLIGLQIYVYNQREDKRTIDCRDIYTACANDHAFIERELNNTPEDKDIFASQYKINRSMLDVTDDNYYIQVYQSLCDAYKSYQASDYQTASTCYQRAYRILRALKEQTGLSEVIKKDYQRRYDESKKYYDICSALLTTEKQPAEYSPLLKLNCISAINKASEDNKTASAISYHYKKYV